MLPGMTVGATGKSSSCSHSTAMPSALGRTSGMSGDVADIGAVQFNLLKWLLLVFPTQVKLAA